MLNILTTRHLIGCLKCGRCIIISYEPGIKYCCSFRFRIMLTWTLHINSIPICVVTLVIFFQTFYILNMLKLSQGRGISWSGASMWRNAQRHGGHVCKCAGSALLPTDRIPECHMCW